MVAHPQVIPMLLQFSKAFHMFNMFSSVSPYNYTVLEYILLKIYQTKTRRDKQPHLQKADMVLGFL